MAAIGLDRSFFIPILNKDRTAFVSFQTFVEHVHGLRRRTTAAAWSLYETNVISTFFIENYWRNDSIVLTNFFAYDWVAKAWITGPKLKWVMNDQISFEVGVNLLQGSKARAQHPRHLPGRRVRLPRPIRPPGTPATGS